MNLAQHLALIPDRVLKGMNEAPGITLEMLGMEIDLEQLLMACPCNCIGGQLYTNYGQWGDRFSIDLQFAIDLGLDAPDFLHNAEELDQTSIMIYYRALEAEWIKQITVLRAQTTFVNLAVKEDELEPA
jgi:hypothetical protein